MAMLVMKCEADEVKSTDRKTASSIDVDVSFLKTDDVDAVSLCDVRMMERLAAERPSTLS